MAGTNERVMDMVRREIDRNPSISSQELFAMAKKMDSGMNRLSIRQFHASYPLQVKRLAKARRRGPGRPPKTGAVKRRRRRRGTAPVATAAAAPAEVQPVRRRGRPPGRRRGRPPGSAAKRDGGSNRDTVRFILTQFAGELTPAQAKAQEIQQVMGVVDRYVDRLLKSGA